MRECLAGALRTGVVATPLLGGGGHSRRHPQLPHGDNPVPGQPALGPPRPPARRRRRRVLPGLCQAQRKVRLRVRDVVLRGAESRFRYQFTNIGIKILYQITEARLANM
eukprot:1194655-Prorocentrum_minimum.AAC.7